MKIGTLDRRVTIEQKSVARDGNFGSEVVSWVTLASVWAGMTEPLDVKLGGAEKVADHERVLVRQVRVRIRYRSDVTSAMRVNDTYRSRILQIVSMAEVGRREALDLMCEAYSV
jgi:SPP1 family predicted phage head-tail adaptor